MPLRLILLVVLCLSATCFGVTADAQDGAPANDCSRPLVLELTTTGSGATKYQMFGKTYSGYPLDDLRRFLSECPASRPLYVVIESHVPIGQIASAVAPKLQVDNVRYFIQYPADEHLVIEVRIGDYLPKLP